MKTFPKEFKYAYHRTNLNNVMSIAKKGFIPGYGDMYGKGWYMCYDLESQLKSSMSLYGSALIKCEIFAPGILIFDYNLSKKIYGDKYTLVDQCLAQRIYRSEEDIPKDLLFMSRRCEETFNQPSFSAAVVGHCFVGGENPLKFNPTDSISRYGKAGSFLTPRGIPKNPRITGVMFSGNHDGNVLVVYSPDVAKPENFAVVEVSSSSPDQITSPDEIVWESLDDVKEVKTRADINRELYEVFGTRIISFAVEGSQPEKCNLAYLRATCPWFLKGKFEAGKFAYDTDDDVLIMKDGVWKSGEFQGMLRDSAVFAGGVYLSKYEFLGYWKGGRWASDYDLWRGQRATAGTKFVYENSLGDFIESKDDPIEYKNKGAL